MSIWLLRRRVGAAVGLALFMVTATGSGEALADVSTSSIDSADRLASEAARVVDEAGVPGASLAVVTPEEIRTRSVGEDGAGEPLGADAKMLWGSVSKPIAATVVMRLAERGELALDDSVIEHLPELKPASDSRIASMTIRQLLNHTSGLPFGAEYLDVDDPQRRAIDVVSELEGIELLSAPGEQYSYSSLGYVLVQAIVERVEGTSLSAAEAELISGLGSGGEVSPGTRFIGSHPQRWATPRDGAGIGYGYQGGSVASLAEFARQTLSGRENLDVMLKGAVDSGGGGGVGLGWRVRDDGVVWHTGTVPGYFSSVHIDRERNIALVVTMNASGLLHEERLLGVTEHLFDLARGVDGAGDGTVEGAVVPVMILIGVAVVCVGVAVAALRWRGRRWTAIGWAVAAALSVVVGWIVVPAILDVPARYIWLWVPELGSALTLIPAVLAAAGVWQVIRPVSGR